MLRKHHKPTFNEQRMQRYFAFLDAQLEKPENQYRSHWRKVLDIASSQRPMYRAFIEAGGTVLKNFVPIESLDKMLEDHFVLCAASRLAQIQKAKSIEDLWAMIDDPIACLLLAELAIASPEQKHIGALRLFCMQCHALDGGKMDLISQMVQYIFSDFDMQLLMDMKEGLVKELQDAADSMKSSKLDTDAYLQCEIWLTPVIDVCDPDADWETMLKLARNFSTLLTRFRRNNDPAVIADLLKGLVRLS
jgi:hypothetical protein